MKQHTTSLEEGVQHIIELYAFDPNTYKIRRKLKSHIQRFLKQFTPFPVSVEVDRCSYSKTGIEVRISANLSYFTITFDIDK